ncbi:queuosine precursor transporter [Rhodocytophaga rosea]|uniref:Probable queuosine precursor transporter n=1 Tax=Rhodocytophaga rosea TaxID=2704465 RepID=A0A6C0GTA4_9BACT|nr:queuosine precursor transporter [Rhodocytophaga rosea]QHT71401.1 queuosine precursor transporter [Rhodocytophaga rosea]
MPTFLSTQSSKRTQLFLLLGGIFLTNTIVAEIIGVKIFSAESLLGIPPAQISLLKGFTLDFNLTAGAVLWPLVFVTSDVINEYFGPAGVKKISYATAGFVLYAFVFIFLITLLPPAAFWIDVNKATPTGDTFDINFAFGKIFRQGLGIIIGSLTAFLLGQLIDAYAFQYIRKITGNKKIWLRATGSTLISQLIDSFVVLIVAFYIFGNWSFAQVISVAIINYIYKFIMAILLTPLLYIAHYWIDRYLGKEELVNSQ